MHVERYGNGAEAYVAIHGWAGSHRTFLPIVDRMPASCSFYCVDLPGYGKTPDPGEWNVFQIASELAAITRSMRNGAVMVGYCGGGNLAMMAAQHAQGSVKRMVLIDPFAYMPLYFRVFTWGDFGQRAYRTTFAGELGRRLTNVALRGKRSGDTDLTRPFKTVNHEVALRALKGFAQVPGPDAFFNLYVDVDLAYGERSFRAVKRGAKMWKAVWPHARLHELRGAGHSPIREATDELCRILFTSKGAP
jgi:pimeloyl-ACP methyl ester carboxylesterase